MNEWLIQKRQVKGVRGGKKYVLYRENHEGRHPAWFNSYADANRKAKELNRVLRFIDRCGA